MAEGAIELFFSYSHKDEPLRDSLAAHLGSLHWEGVISSWHDRRIEPGTEWDGEIKTYLNTADIILLLISANFINSRYCREIEIQQAMARHEAREALVIPVILRPCDWTRTPFGKLQALPKNGEPITLWSNIDAAFLDVVQGIRTAAQTIERWRKLIALEKYQQKVEEFATDCEISGIESMILEDFQETLGLTNDEARNIRDEVLKPCDYEKKKRDKYRQAFANEIAKHGFPVSDKARAELKVLQNYLNLTDESVQQIENEIVQLLGNSTDKDQPLYSQLEAFLKAEQWEEADWETCRVMHRVLGKEYIKVKDLRTFPCEAIVAIDQLWSKYSNNKFGFGIQATLWRELDRDDEAFDVRVGWRQESAKRQRRRQDLTFSLDAPIGHLPAFYKSWGGGGWSWKDYILARTKDCFP